MRSVRKLVKIFLVGALTIIGLLLILIVLLYIPPIQNFVKDKALGLANSASGYTVSTDRILLKFPLSLKLEKVLVLEASGDTMVNAAGIEVNVALWELLRKNIRIRHLYLEEVGFQLKDTVSGLNLKAEAGLLTVGQASLDLNDYTVSAALLNMEGGDIYFHLGESVAADTVTSESVGWKFAVEEIALKDVNCLMEGSSSGPLKVGGREIKIRKGDLRLDEQQLSVGSIFLDAVYCDLLLGETVDEEGGNAGMPAVDAVSLADTSVWTVNVKEVELADCRFSMQPDGEEGAKAVFPQRIVLSSIALRMDDIYNRGTEVAARIKNLQLKEEGGLSVERLTGDIALRQTKIGISHLLLKTAESELEVEVGLESGLTGFNAQTPLAVNVKGKIGAGDVLFFLPDVPEGFFKEGKLKLDVDVSGSLADLNLARLTIDFLPDLSFTSRGKIRNLNDTDRLSGALEFSAALKNGELSDLLLAKDTSEQRLFLPSMSLKGKAALDGRDASLSLLVLPEHEGRLAIDAEYGLKDENYKIDIVFDRFDLASFLPKDSLGMLTASLAASGKGFDPETADADLHFRMDSLGYKGDVLTDFFVDAVLKQGSLTGELNSAIPDLLMDLHFGMTQKNGDYTASLKGEIGRFDLSLLDLMPEEFAVSLAVDLDAALREDGHTSLTGDFSGIQIKSGEGLRKLGDLSVDVLTAVDSSYAKVKTGDLRLTFGSGAGRDELLSKFEATVTELSDQMSRYRFDMDSLRSKMPDFQLSLQASRNNLLNYYLEETGVFIHSLDVQMDLLPREEFVLRTLAKGVSYDAVLLDSVTLRVAQEGSRLAYAAGLFNSTAFLGDFALFSLFGDLAGDQLNVRTRELDKAGKPIVDIGASIYRQDTLFQVTIKDTLMLGYVPWQVNAGNFIRLRENAWPEGNLLLTNNEKKVSAITENVADGGEVLKVAIENIDLGLMCKSLTFLPEMSGIFTAGVSLTHQSGITADGAVYIKQLFYEEGRVGNVNLKLGYHPDKQQTHNLDLLLQLDGSPVLTANGSVGTSEYNNKLAVAVEISKLPLPVLEAFLPRETLSLGGTLQGKMNVGGTTSAPDWNGSLTFNDVVADVVALGTTFKVDDKVIRIADGKIRMEQFGILAPNKQRLEIGGTVDISSLSNIKTDLSFTARNFQVIKAKPNTASMVDGSAYVDLNLTVKGALEALAIHGNAKVLDNSTINYTLRDSPLEVTDRSIDLVRFVSFVDTLFVAPPKKPKSVQRSRADMQVALTISPLVKVTVNLSENGNDGIVINGGGTLNFFMNDMGDMRLVGRYALSGGTVIYNVPVVGEKKFVIQEGNYIEWNGDIVNPGFNISAVETVTAAGKNDGVVTFNVIIRITGSLSRPEIVFDLAAVGSPTIQNQISGMTAEERSKNAMNLLITGSYSGPDGESVKSDVANNAVNSLVERELNNWSRRNLKGVELSFGIDSYNQDSESGTHQRTDYSYQFSKRLFNNRVRVKIGGRISTDDGQEAGDVEENLVDDISLEYMFTKNPNYFLKLFRHTGYESVLEGEVTKTGIGIVLRKKFERFIDIFRSKKNRENRKNATE